LVAIVAVINMKLKTLFIFCFLISPFSLMADDLMATVDYVFDGDTFSSKVLFEDKSAITVRVRIRNIDAPEIHGMCEYETERAGQAWQRLRALLPKGTKVKLSKIKDDKYLGRIDALVYLDGKDIGQMLIDEKLVRKYDGGKRMPWCPTNEIKEVKNDK
jgi:micrococcal nuclease